MSNVIRDKKGRIVKGNNFDSAANSQVKETAEGKEKKCNRCKKVIGAKEVKCPFCYAPTSWER
jgi:hypothetical protein